MMSMFYSNTKRNSTNYSDKFALHVSKEELVANPGFAALLSELNDLLTCDTVSSVTQNKLKQAEDTLHHEKLIWFHAHILHTQIQEIILDYSLLKEDNSLNIAEQEYLNILEQCLNYAEAHDYLNFSYPQVDISLFGLEDRDLQENNPNLKDILSIQHKLISHLEGRLRKRCEYLFSSYRSSIYTESGVPIVAEMAQLPYLVEQTQREIGEKKQQLRLLRLEREQQFWIHFKALVDTVSQMEMIVKKHHLGKQEALDGANRKFLSARCESMCLKMKLLELQVLCDTYTNEAIGALSKLRNHHIAIRHMNMAGLFSLRQVCLVRLFPNLKSNWTVNRCFYLQIAIRSYTAMVVLGSKQHLSEMTSVRQQDVDHISLALKAYRSVGYGFDELAQQYGSLMREIENKQWALNQFGEVNAT